MIQNNHCKQELLKLTLSLFDYRNLLASDVQKANKETDSQVCLATHTHTLVQCTLCSTHVHKVPLIDGQDHAMSSLMMSFPPGSQQLALRAKLDWVYTCLPSNFLLALFVFTNHSLQYTHSPYTSCINTRHLHVYGVFVHRQFLA